jgi:ABC-type amino acid transport substrate-binding protein
LTIGTRTGSPPFGYINKNNEWVGFSIDLVEQTILPLIAKKLGKQVKLEKKESTPQTRIPLLSSNAVDLVAETMTDTRARRESVDFSSLRAPSSWREKRVPSKVFKRLPANALPPSKAPLTRASFATGCQMRSW